MKILVTGGAGFIGSHSVEALLAMGHAVRVLDNLSTGERRNVPAPVDLIVGDVRDADAARAAARGVDAVLHLAGLVGATQSLTHPLETYAVNTHGAVSVFEAARLEGVRRVVLASTAAVYGDVPGCKSETSPVRCLVPYAASKWMAEQAALNYARSFGMEVVRLRYFNAFGARQRADSPYAGVTALFANAIKTGRPCVVFGDGSNTRDYIAVRDVARANAQALVRPLPARALDDPQEPRCPVYNVASGASASVNDVLDAFERLLGRPVEHVNHPPRAGEIEHSSADVGRARDELAWQAVISLEQGLRELLQG